MRVEFLSTDGHREERLAYFDDGRWKAWFTTTRPGDYRATLTRNGQPVETAPVDLSVDADEPIPLGGFVRVRGLHFADDSGRRYFPLGHNLGWQHPGILPLTEQLRGMGAAGMNWTRVWACAWDGKNPLLPPRRGGSVAG